MGRPVDVKERAYSPPVRNISNPVNILVNLFCSRAKLNKLGNINNTDGLKGCEQN